jgi:hypothetical protein
MIPVGLCRPPLNTGHYGYRQTNQPDIPDACSSKASVSPGLRHQAPVAMNCAVCWAGGLASSAKS